MNITIERKRNLSDINNSSAIAASKPWSRDDFLAAAGGGKSINMNIPSTKSFQLYYGPTGTKKDNGKPTSSQQHQIRQQHSTLNAIMDNKYISSAKSSSSMLDFQNNDYANNQIKIQNIQQQIISFQRCSTSNTLKRKLPAKTSTTTHISGSVCNINATTSISSSTNTATIASSQSSISSSTNANVTTSSLCNSPSGNSNACNIIPSTTLRHHLDFSRNIRTDVSLVPPIRQTASIFKQPVTVYKTQDSKVKNDIKHGTIQDKPKQLFWEKRLEGLRACDINGIEFNKIDLPKSIKSVGPNVNEQTLLRSVSTALHCSNLPVTGQTVSKATLLANSGVFLNPEQPLMHLVTITDDDIKKQEDRVNLARRRLQDALKG